MTGADATAGDDTANQPSISVIMPVYNGTDFIASSLPPLVAMAQRGDVLEVIVVDDGSTDGTVQAARQLGIPRTTLYHLIERFGLGD